MSEGIRINESRITETTGRNAKTTESRFEVHELNLTRLEREFKKAEDAYYEVRDRKADGELAKAQKTLDLETARNNLRELAETTKTIAGEALDDTQSLTASQNAKPMRLDDKDAAIANVRLPLVNAEANGLDLGAIYTHLENTLVHDEKGLMYCWILAAERRIKEVRESKSGSLPEVQRDMADLSGLVRRSRERLQDKRNDGIRERAVKISSRASALTRRSRKVNDQFRGGDVVTPEMKQYSFVGKRDKLIPPVES